MLVHALVAPPVQTLSPYQPGKPVAELARELGLAEQSIVKLASNENPCGCSAKVLLAITEGLNVLARYPDGAAYELRQALAGFYRVHPEQITLGNGSNDVLEIIAHTFLTQEHHIVVSEYAFAIYALVAQAMGVGVVEVPAQDFAHDLSAMAQAISASTRLIFIANPNNPTGTFAAHEQIRCLLKAVPDRVLVVLDEAYLEYATQGGVDAARWIHEFPNLIVCRTFSKAYGLAALRVGYALSSTEVAEYLNRVRQPFNVGTLSMRAAVAALADQDFVQFSCRVNAEGKSQLMTGLQHLPVRVLPSDTNFLCINLGRAALPVYSALLQQGVIVRPLGAYRMPEHLRVSVGTAAENERFLQAFRCVL